MTSTAINVEEIVIELLTECVDIDPPLTGAEIVTLFNERIILESETLVSLSLHSLVEQRKVEATKNAFRLCSTPAAA